jgi:hypothetical protein
MMLFIPQKHEQFILYIHTQRRSKKKTPCMTRTKSNPKVCMSFNDYMIHDQKKKISIYFLFVNRFPNFFSLSIIRFETSKRQIDEN